MRVANGVLPNVIANIAALTPIFVPIKNLVMGAIATILGVYLFFDKI